MTRPIDHGVTGITVKLAPSAGSKLADAFQAFQDPVNNPTPVWCLGAGGREHHIPILYEVKAEAIVVGCPTCGWGDTIGVHSPQGRAIVEWWRIVREP